MQLPKLFQSKRRLQMEEQLKALPKLQNTISALQTYINRNTINMGTQFINDSIVMYPDWNISETTNKYSTSDHIYSVINKIAETTAAIPFYSYIKKSDQATSKYLSFTSRQFYTSKGMHDLRMMQIKALVDAPENDPLNVLLENPNEYQTKTEFTLACYIYYLLNGEAFIWKERVQDGANKGKIKYIHVWAPDKVVIHVTRSYPQTITGYSFIVNGQTVIEKAAPENVIHWKRFNPCNLQLTSSDLRGLSPLKPLVNTITRLSESDTRSLSQIKNGGVPGIVYDESVEASEVGQPEFDLQKKAFYDFTTNDQNTGAPFFVGSKKGYIALGLKLADMDLAALNKIDFARICNVYKVSNIVFNNDGAATESNVQEMIKQMYTNACLPMNYSLRDILNKELANEFNRFLDSDISAITELQDDMLSLANAIAAMPAAPSVNEQRELWKYERNEDPLCDKPLIKQGYMFIEDVGGDTIPLDTLQP